MTIETLLALLLDHSQVVKPTTEVLIRINEEALDEPNGCVFRLASLEVTAGCGEVDKIVLDCDQSEDEDLVTDFTPKS